MLREIWEKHTGKIIGTSVGVVLGFIYLIWGFWDMLIFAFIVTVSFLAGRRLDRQEPLSGLGELWQRLMERWRMFR